MACQTRVYQALLLSVVIIAIIYPHLGPKGYFPILSPLHSSETTITSQRFLSKSGHTLRLDFYEHKCRNVLLIVRSAVAEIVSKNPKAPAQLLRLMFHDCFIRGCDGSILFAKGERNGTNRSERDEVPNSTLKGFDFVDQIKDKVERACPGVVSCSDILVIATRDALNLSGGPFFTVLLGRKDSLKSYPELSLNDIPSPDDNISTIIDSFSLRNFSHRETVALLGSHNIGQMDCQFIMTRFQYGDPTLSADFQSELNLNCSQGKVAISSGSVFDSHYYQNLIQGRGLLHADQQLMADNETAEWVIAYANSPGTMFRKDFTRAMSKMAHLQAPAGTQGEVRKNCAWKNPLNKSDAPLQFNFRTVVLITLWVSRMLV